MFRELVGPLLQYADGLPGQSDEMRARLRSTARRVVARQLAPMLSVTATGPGSHPGFLEVSLNSDVLQPVEPLQSRAIPQKELSFVWFPRNFVPPRERPFDLDVRTSPPLAGHQ